MKRKIGNLLLIGTLSLLASCGEINGGTSIAKPSVTPPSTSTTTKPSEDVTFSATLNLNGSPFYLTDSEVEAIWQNNTTTVQAPFNEDSVATTQGLDGEYYVHLTKSPKNYTYDPNQTIVTTDNPNCNIELMRLAKPSTGSGKDLFNNIYSISDIKPNAVGRSYAFEATINSASEVVYYQFVPKVAGSYTIESMVDMFDNKINPKVLTFYTGPTSTAQLDQEINSGGTYLDGGYTRNFKFQVDFTESALGGVAKFGIKAEINDSITYPVTIPFKITYQGEYNISKVNNKIMYAEEMYYKRDNEGNYIVDENGHYILNYVKMNPGEESYDYDYGLDGSHSSTFYNQLIDPSYVYDGVHNKYLRRRFKLVNGEYVASPDGDYILKSTLANVERKASYYNFMSYSGFSSGSSTILNQKNLVYNEEDGYYHYIINGEDNIVCANLMDTIELLGVSIVGVEDDGKLWISKMGTNQYDENGLRIIENYKYFLDAEYIDCVNGDGTVYVTKELMTFLQKLCNSTSYFFDGYGWLETEGNIFAADGSEWMFACGFYSNQDLK